MTQSECIAVVRELRALEQLEVAVKAQMMQPGASDAWRYALLAFDDRIRWCRYCLSLEHPTAVGMAEELAQATLHGSRSTVERESPAITADKPPAGRIH